MITIERALEIQSLQHFGDNKYTQQYTDKFNVSIHARGITPEERAEILARWDGFVSGASCFNDALNSFARPHLFTDPTRYKWISAE